MYSPRRQYGIACFNSPLNRACQYFSEQSLVDERDEIMGVNEVPAVVVEQGSR